MNLIQTIKAKFQLKRVIANGSFIPEIDGLRFIAITTVVVYHIIGFLTIKNKNVFEHAFHNSFLARFASNGHYGVELFFVISGFILALPFAKFYLSDGNRVVLKDYFIRRVTRLEPPYFLVMIILFIGTVFIAHKLSPIDGITSLSASLLYLHNILLNDSIPLINCVTWSLEIEIQFYLLAPILVFVYKIKSRKYRFLIYLLLILTFCSVKSFHYLPFTSVINYLQYFILGIFIADIHLSKLPIFHFKFNSIINVACFFGIFLIKIEQEQMYYSILLSILQLLLIFIFYHNVLINKSSKFLALSTITNIGGMCYSIYLLHFPIISLFGNIFVKYQLTNYSLLDNCIWGVAFLLLILFMSSIFYVLIERPCMDKYWYKKFKFSNVFIKKYART